MARDVNIKIMPNGGFMHDADLKGWAEKQNKAEQARFNAIPVTKAPKAGRANVAPAPHAPKRIM